MSELDPERAADLAAAPLARAYLAEMVSPVDVTEVLLNRIEAHGDAVFITVTAERARREAEAAAKRYRAGQPASPLDGVPIAWKDLYDMAGEVTTVGSALFRHAPPAEADAPTVAALAAAGMVALGKVNLTEFAYSGLGLNPHFGTPANAADPDVPRAPGGSSSGSGVAVAARLAPVAIGSDTGGSVRVPAAFNGVVGYKSSEGRISTVGAFPLSASLDTVGPLARTVEDCILVDAAFRGTVPALPPIPLDGLSLVVSEDVFLDDCEPTVVDAFEAALKRLEAAGVSVAWRHIPEIAEAGRLAAEIGTIVSVEAYDVHRERVDGPEVEEIDGRVTARILRGKAMPASGLVTLQRARARLMRSLGETLETSFVVGPTVAHVAPEIAPLDADPELFHRVNLKTLRNTSIGNFLNTPGVALPMASASLPVSFLISAPAGGDDRVLAAARAIEATVRDD